MTNDIRRPDKKGNNRDGFVAAVGLTVQNVAQYQGRIRTSAGSATAGVGILQGPGTGTFSMSAGKTFAVRFA
jgi:hypothetical protein